MLCMKLFQVSIFVLKYMKNYLNIPFQATQSLWLSTRLYCQFDWVEMQLSVHLPTDEMICLTYGSYFWTYLSHPLCQTRYHLRKGQVAQLFEVNCFDIYYPCFF